MNVNKTKREKTYTGSTGRSFNTRNKMSIKKNVKRKLQDLQPKSAISDHCKRNNHIMEWDNTKILGSGSNKFKHWIKEAVEIRR